MNFKTISNINFKNISKLEHNIFNNLDNILIENYIKYLSEHYYNNKSIISDIEWDNLYDLYKKKNPNSDLFENVGTIPIKDKVELPVYMGSLNKIKPNTKEFLNFVNNQKYNKTLIVSEKLDGVSLLIYISNYKLQIFTRGNGYIGQDVTKLFINTNIIPALSHIKNLVVRGELILPKEYKSNSNLRNIVSGYINSKEQNKDLIKYIKFIAYSLINIDNNYLDEKSSLNTYNYLDRFKLLEKLGFITPIYTIINDFDKITDSSLFFSKLLTDWRIKNKYDIDGLVISYNVYEQIVIGKNPSYSKAFKTIILDQLSETNIKYIEWNISKDNYLNPTIIIEPVLIGKCKISRITGNNARFVVNNDLGKGSKIQVIRSGDVIPKIHKVLTKGIINYPLKDYEWCSNNINFILTNYDNKEKLLLHFINTLNIKFIKDSFSKKLIENGIDSINKLINLNEIDLMKLPGVQEKNAIKITKSLKTSINNCNIIDLLVATNKLGRHFSKNRLSLILSNCSKNLLFDNILNNIKYDSLILDKLKLELMAIKGISDKLSKIFINNLDNLRIFLNNSSNNDLNILFIDKLNNYYFKNNISNTLYSKKLDSISFCFTGFRDQCLFNLIEKEGGIIKNIISKKLDYLVIKDSNNIDKNSSKYIKANELNIKVIDKKILLQMYDL